MIGAIPSYLRDSLYRSRCQPVAQALRSEDVLHTVLIVLLTFVAFLALFILRPLDDNRLTSWQWVFTGGRMLEILISFVAGLLLVSAFAKTTLSLRMPAVPLFVSSFATAIVFWGEPEVIVDAARYFMQAKHLEVYGVGNFFQEWGKDISVWTDLPLIPFLYGLIFHFFGETRIGIQLFTTILFSGTVVLTYLIGRMLWNKTVGVYGGMLLLGMPYLLTQVPLMLVDVPTMFFLTLAIYATIKAIKQGGAWPLAAACTAIALAMFAKYSTWLMLSIVPVIFLSQINLDRKEIVLRASVITVGATLLAGALVIWKFDVVAEQIRLLLSYQLPGLQRWQESHVSTFLFQIHPYITLAALYSIYAALKKRDARYAIIGWLLFVIVFLEIKRIRYILVVFPMLALMASYGLTQIKNANISRTVVSCAVASSLALAIFGYLPFLQNTSTDNIKQAGGYLNSIAGENVVVYALPQTRSIINPAVSVALLDLFTEKKISYSDAGSLKLKPSPELIETSPLRFTWAYKNPEYFISRTDPEIGEAPVVIISSDADQVVPEHIAQKISGYRLSRKLVRSIGIFRYKTIVRVYEPA